MRREPTLIEWKNIKQQQWAELSWRDDEKRQNYDKFVYYDFLIIRQLSAALVAGLG